MRHFFFLALLVIAFSCEQRKVETYYPNGNIKEVISFKNDKISGLYSSYYPTGELKAEGFYEDDKVNGIYRDYFKNGKVKLERHYIRGIQNGKELRFYQDGSIAEIGYRKYGKRFGDYFFLDSLDQDTLAYAHFSYDTVLYEKSYFTRDKFEVQHYSMSREIKIDPNENSTLCFRTYSPVDINLVLIIGDFVGNNYQILDTLDVQYSTGKKVCYKFEEVSGDFNAHLMELDGKGEIIGGSLIDIHLEDYFK